MKIYNQENKVNKEKKKSLRKDRVWRLNKKKSDNNN